MANGQHAQSISRVRINRHYTAHYVVSAKAIKSRYNNRAPDIQVHTLLFNNLLGTMQETSFIHGQFSTSSDAQF